MRIKELKKLSEAAIKIKEKYWVPEGRTDAEYDVIYAFRDGLNPEVAMALLDIAEAAKGVLASTAVIQYPKLHDALKKLEEIK